MDMSVDSGNDGSSDGHECEVMMEVHSSRELKVAEEGIDVKGKVKVGVKGEGVVDEGAVVKGGVTVKGGVVVKGAVKAAAAATMMGKATQEVMPSLPFCPTLGVLLALVT